MDLFKKIKNVECEKIEYGKMAREFEITETMRNQLEKKLEVFQSHIDLYEESGKKIQFFNFLASEMKNIKVFDLEIEKIRTRAVLLQDPSLSFIWQKARIMRACIIYQYESMKTQIQEKQKKKLFMQGIPDFKIKRPSIYMPYYHSHDFAPYDDFSPEK